MNILAVDPGATRAGWAVLGPGPTYIESCVEHFPRAETESFQEYRLKLCQNWVDISHELFKRFSPVTLITETVPSRGPEIMDQLYLANVQVTTMHAIAYAYGIKVVQVGARTVQAKIARRKPDVKVTKPQVRNGVIDRVPELTDYLKGSKVFEESDAIAVGLWYLKG